MPTKKTTKKVTVKKAVTKKSAKKAVVKKATKKAAVKKTTKKPTKKTTKKKATRATVKRPVKRKLVFADGDKSFWMTNGQVVNSLVTLRDALDQMEKEVYVYHAGKAHNDFAQWVSEVLADHDCAVDLSKAKTPKSAKIVVIRHLKYYAV